MASAAACLLLGAGGGCGRQDPDATANQTCQAIAIPCPPRTQCDADVDCPSGNVCDAERAFTDVKSMCPQIVCQPHCDPDANQSCLTGSRCLPDGHCQIIPCDDPESTPCPTHFRCDPIAAPNEPVSVDGSDVNTGYEYPKDIARGCVRKRCDEPDGHLCLPNWECTPETATDASGCRPVPCTESGQCLDDDHICVPTSDKPRPDGTDFFGCVVKNCEEGYSCSVVVEGVDIRICDFDSPVADALGCAWKPCNNETPCARGVCDPTSVKHDILGCREKSCPDEATCSPDQTCIPTPGDPAHGTCGYPVSSGGSSGTGGVPPTSGTGGVPPTNGTGGLPPTSGTGGVPSTSGTGGVPPTNGTGGVPPTGGTGGQATDGTGPDGCAD